MINRSNYQAVKRFIEYRREVLQKDPLTITGDRVLLRGFLVWADKTPFTDAEKLRPVFPRYVADVKPLARNGGEHMSPDSASKMVNKARAFMIWARLHLPEYKRVSPEWIDTLRPPKMDNPERKHKAVTLEMVRQLLSVRGDTLRVVRAKAACAFLFLSGIRATAFCTLPIGAIDMDKRTVRQLVALGVKTKNRKNAVTVLMNVPDLLEAVGAWDKIVRAKLPETSVWFAALAAADGGKSVISDSPAATSNRDGALRQEVAHLFELAGLPYLSPHKFRHGHATYGLKQARDIGDLKAVSQNLMHANIGITDGIYAILSTEDMQERIALLGKGTSATPEVTAPAPVQDVAALLEEALRRMGITPETLQRLAVPPPDLTKNKAKGRK